MIASIVFVLHRVYLFISNQYKFRQPNLSTEIRLVKFAHQNKCFMVLDNLLVEPKVCTVNELLSFSNAMSEHNTHNNIICFCYDVFAACGSLFRYM